MKNEWSVTLRLRHWLPLKRRGGSGKICWLSVQGMMVECSERFPIGGRVSVDIYGPQHCIRAIPAEIVRAEPAAGGTRYSLRFRYSERRGSDTSHTILGYLAAGFSSRDN